MKNIRYMLVSCFITIIISAIGHPVYDFDAHYFSGKNLLILIFAVGTAMLMMTKEEKDV